MAPGLHATQARVVPVSALPVPAGLLLGCARWMYVAFRDDAATNYAAVALAQPRPCPYSYMALAPVPHVVCDRSYGLAHLGHVPAAWSERGMVAVLRAAIPTMSLTELVSLLSRLREEG